MKINIRAFTIAFTVVMSILILVITVWARLSGIFGREFMDLYNSVHPHPFRVTLGGLTPLEHVYGVGLDLFYAVVDSLVFSLSFGFLYNWLAGDVKSAENQDKAD